MSYKSMLFILWLAALDSFAQKNVIVRGKVVDSKTKQPLVNASVRLKGLPHATASDMEGNFEFALPDGLLNDTLFVSYVGYRVFRDKLSNLDFTNKVYLLEEAPTLLDEVMIFEKKLYKFELKKLEASMKLIKGNLYASKTEVTNDEYHQFLKHLLQSGQMPLYKKYKPDITNYEGTLLIFFKGYHLPQLESTESTYNNDYDDYPVVNISYEAALAYCNWLTELYNTYKGKKKFTKVSFKLPNAKEWQIAALGYKKFQSWELEENEVEVSIPEQPGDEVGKLKKMIPVKGNVLYPWFGAHDYRNKPQNKRNCWMGNFKVPDESIPCVISRPGGDGYLITGKVSTYFPNGMGLYDVVGNVAEMIDEKSKACGGSWDHLPEQSTIVSIDNYSGTSGAVGFRVFMEVAVGK
jgi:formylglycine-generating enzyme required for sulfatase activity